ncbi:hypothetical protein HAR85_004706 [Vibrio parahaemolyticus]|nr:hypothetical protein [Vibrio parahaemolyticus]EHH2866471.1 hypothetical protein [Vibrio parahaemolyticus]
MSGKVPYQHLNVFLVKDEYKALPLHKFLKANANFNTYELKQSLDISGKFFVREQSDSKPKWTKFAESLTGTTIEELYNRTSSAVLVVKSTNATMAFTFGYGRHMLDTSYFVSDFGIKTALNTLNHDSLRSVDLITLDDQAVQKKAQAARETGVEVFGIDISKDLLRGVTGSPKGGVGLFNISGCGTTFSFGKSVKVEDIPDLVDVIFDHYKSDAYQASFSWVDNIRRLQEPADIQPLDDRLLSEINNNSSNVIITIPEMMDWDQVFGFSFTRSKSNIKPTIESHEYYANLDLSSLSVDALKRDKLFVFDQQLEETEFKVYNCMYFEIKENSKTYILFSGDWYEIESSFISIIDGILAKIKPCALSFPEVFTWTGTDSKNRVVEKIESEGDYNERAAQLNGYYVLDKKLVKSDRTTTSIELCDLLTPSKQFIHVKHRKGGSAGLSHLFAQGNVSAEIMLGDRNFRKQARKVLRSVSSAVADTVPLDNIQSSNMEIVFLVLGEDSSTLKDNLPFFSKVNLTKTYENLSQRGFKVSIAGVGKVTKP